MTVSGPVSGSTVIESTEREAIKFMGSMDGFHRRNRGQAVAIKLGDQYLFALVDSEHGFGIWRSAKDCYRRQFTPSQEALRRGNLPPEDPFTHEQRARMKACKAEQKANGAEVKRAIGEHRPFEILPAHWPTFVYFTDEHDPQTMREADPADLPDELSPGLRVTKITVHETDEDVTAGIERILPWVYEQGPYRTEITRRSSTEALSIGLRDAT